MRHERGGIELAHHRMRLLEEVHVPEHRGDDLARVLVAHRRPAGLLGLLLKSGVGQVERAREVTAREAIRRAQVHDLLGVQLAGLDLPGLNDEGERAHGDGALLAAG